MEANTSPFAVLANRAATPAPAKALPPSTLLNWLRSSPTTKMMTQVHTITPAVAREILETYNTQNRPLKTGKVKEFAQAMREGRWKLTSQGIAFSKSGALSNGQHRLFAVLESGCSVEMNVTINEEDEAFVVLDSEMTTRGGADTAALLGYKNATVLAAGCRIVAAYLRGHMSADRMTNAELNPFILSHPQTIEAASVAHKVGNALKVSNAGVMLAHYAISIHTTRPALVEEFFARLYDGDRLGKSDPIKIAREMLMTRTVGGGAAWKNGVKNAFAVAIVIVNAWNLHATRQRGSRAKIDVTAATTSFPEIV